MRQDPFSLFRSTFDIRTYRLCRRVLMFHHFPDELDGTADYLVRSTDFEYKETPVASFIASMTQAAMCSSRTGSYFKKSLPKLEFKYTEVQVDETVHEIDAESIKNLPYGVDGTRYQWVDLDSEGLDRRSDRAGRCLVLQAQPRQRHIRPARSGSCPSRPWPRLSGGQQQLLDLAGEGHLDLVQFDGPMAGFYERTAGRRLGAIHAVSSPSRTSIPKTRTFASWTSRAMAFRTS